MVLTTSIRGFLSTLEVFINDLHYKNSQGLLYLLTYSKTCRWQEIQWMGQWGRFSHSTQYTTETILSRQWIGLILSVRMTIWILICVIIIDLNLCLQENKQSRLYKWWFCIISARQHAERAICYRPSVCHTGGSVKNGWTYHRNSFTIW